jgi:outer membrane receptor protein involved in Fe transport
MKSTRLARTLSVFNALALTLVMLVPLSARTVMAQATTGTIRGSVNDQAGAAVAGVTVTATNQATNITTAPFKTTGEGFYEIPNLMPGLYTVTVEAAGFSRSQTTNITVSLGQVATIDVALKPGAVTETVTVVAGTEEVINRDQSQIATTFETRKVEELPSNAAGSGLDTLALLIPGVAQATGQGTNTNGTGFSVNGNRGRSNNFQIDGSDNNDLSVGGPSLFVDNADQVSEYQVVTNNFSAQYGRNLGAIVNIVTKGGTNEFHGSAFEFFRDQHNLDSLNNREKASGRTDPPRALSNVFGGTIGGPIVKNRAFFFGSYQGIRQPQETLATSTGFGIFASELPKLTAGFPGNGAISTLVTQNPSVLPLGTLRARSDLRDCNATVEKAAGRAFRDCNRDFIDIGTTTANTVRVEGFLLERLYRTDFTQNEYSLRGDMKITNKDNFYVRYLNQKGTNLNAGGSTNGFTYNLPATSKNLGGTYTRQIGSRMVNEARAVWQKIAFKFGGGCTAGSPGCIPDPNEIEQGLVESVSYSGVRGVTLTGNALRTIGGGAGLPQGRVSTVDQFADNLTFTAGSHSVITGGEIKYTKASVPFLPNFNGSFTFSSVTRLVNNAPSAISIALGSPIIDYDEWDQYYFVQDDWKVKENLTLNLGLRYEYTGQPINDLNDLTRAREADASTALFNPALPIESRVTPRIPNDKNNFAPRVGFAWSPRFSKGTFMSKLLGGDDATVIRGGYAIAYDPAFYNILLNVANSSPVSLLASLSTNVLPASGSPFPLPGPVGSDIRARAQSSGILPVGKLDPKWLSQTIVSPNFHSPYSQQWSIGFQRQVNRNNVAEVRYVGNHGVGLFQNSLDNPFVATIVNGLPSQTVCTARNAAGTCTATQVVTFPSFPNLLPSGVKPLTCTDIASTPDNEGACNGRISPRGRVLSRANTSQSRYDSLQARYNGRFLNNSLNLGAAYTFSKTLDNASEIFARDTENSVSPQNPFDPLRAERSYSSLHRPHLFSTNFIYDVPYFKEQRGWMGHLLGGFQLNGTYVYNSGRPYTATQTNNGALLGLGASYLPDSTEGLRPFYGNSNADPRKVGITQVDAALFGLLSTVTDVNGIISYNDLNNGIVTPVTKNDVRFVFNGPGAARLFGTPFGNVPRNSLFGPPINQVNLGFFKTTRVFESVRVQFRAELFNALNHPQPGFGSAIRSGSVPSINIQTAGVAGSEFAENTNITFARRVVQFGLRIIF